MDRSELAAVVFAHLHEHAHLPPGLDIDPSNSLQDLGINSMDAMEIVHSLARARQVRLSPVQIARLRTIDQLIDLMDQAGPDRES